MGGELVRTPAQFFFEVGFGASWAEAFVALNVAPFPLTDAKVEHAWEIAGEAHDDPVEFERMLALADAAPDLLEALQDILQTIDAQVRDGIIWDPETVASARKALSLATGERK